MAGSFKSTLELAIPLTRFQVEGKPCQQTDDLDTHFPEVERDANDKPVKGWQVKFQQAEQKAKDICAECDDETREKCLIFALSNDIYDGIWGGTTGDERRVLNNRLTLSIAKKALTKAKRESKEEEVPV